MAQVTLENLTKKFKNTTAVRNLSIDIQDQEFFVLLGPTGAGKTTLLNALSSSIPDDERIVTIEDSAELLLQNRHVVRMETRPANTEGRGEVLQRDLIRNCKERGIDVKTPWEDLSEDEHEWIYYGDGAQTSTAEPTDMEALEALWQSGAWYGVKGFFDWLETKAYKMHVRIFLSRYRSYTTCSTCRGRRLQPEALCFKINGKTLPDLWSQPISELLPWFAELSSNSKFKMIKQYKFLTP